MISIPHRTVLASLFVGGALLAGVSTFTLKPAAQGTTREFTISGDQFAFKPLRIEVQKDDLVKITFTAKDIPHSFTIDRYRIAKRVEPGKSIVFEFRADQPGRFPIYCSLATDERCKEMTGELIVEARK